MVVVSVSERTVSERTVFSARLVATGEAAGGDGEPPAGCVAELGGWLRARRRVLDAGEAGWLEGLARFDREGGWAVDGALSTVGWLVAWAGMARSSAYE